MAKNVLTEKFSEPLNGALTARIDVHVGDGNLVMDRLPGSEQVLASGALEYLEHQGLPTRTLALSNGQSSLTLKAGSGAQAWFRLPWAACNGATDWKIHLNPMLSSDITARSNGGNIKLDLSGMIITCVSADNGGGNIDVVLPDNAANLNVAARTGGGRVTIEVGRGTTGSNIVSAKSGAGNVIVRIPSGLAARIHATTGMGKATIDSRFSKIDNTTFQSSDYDSAVNKVEITAQSGAGNVNVDIK
jgi:hypothetical protein